VALFGLALLGLPASGATPATEGGLKVGTLPVGKILFLGNSITQHGPAPDIGWTGNWGMAASAPERDYVHRLQGRIAREAGGVPRVMVRNIADFEREQTDFDIRAALKEELAFEADVVILAIGENAPSSKTDEARKRFADALRDLLALLGQHGHPKIFVRSQFWPDAEKDRILKKACDDAGGVFVDIEKLGTDPTNAARSERQIGHAGVAGHPGDKGMAAIADVLWMAMKRSGEPKVRSARITILSTMLADTRGLGEWGFAALVEADGRRLLFDTGARPDTVLANARELGVDLSEVTEVVLSHHHRDHTGGLLTLRRSLMTDPPRALSRVYVGRGIFLPRPKDGGGDANETLALKAPYEATEGGFVEVGEPTEIGPGIWLTGPVPRKHPERNWSGRGRVQTAGGLAEDTIPEDMSLVLDTERGLVVVTGCGHAGVVNTLEFARERVRAAPVFAVVGGLHLFDADGETLDWTADKLRAVGLSHLLGAHCTGIEAVHILRDRLKLDRRTCVVGAVGSGFDLGEGVRPGTIAR
jgi:7,8-dihydropterin-6-yl-methyl-4-(beta-D-ribofuranosyl)aminobenzene 5'-phosphate synthase